MPKVNLTQDVLAESGLDIYEPGDTVYLPVKCTILGKDGEVTGITIEGLGPVSDSSATEFVDAYGEDDNSDLENKSQEAIDQKPIGDEVKPDDENLIEDSGEPAEEPVDDSKEEDILGYKRPKAKKFKLPKASDIFGD